MDGKFNENGIEVEHSRILSSFNWLNNDYQGVNDHTLVLAMRKWDEEDGYYGHEVKIYKGE